MDNERCSVSTGMSGDEVQLHC